MNYWQTNNLAPIYEDVENMLYFFIGTTNTQLA